MVLNAAWALRDPTVVGRALVTLDSKTQSSYLQAWCVLVVVAHAIRYEEPHLAQYQMGREITSTVQTAHGSLRPMM